MDDREAYEFYLDPEHLKLTGPARKRKPQKLTSISSVRFAPEVTEAAKAIAHEEGITVGSWIRRLVQREIEAPETVEMALEGLPEPVRLPAAAVRDLAAALMPVLLQHGEASLAFGSPRAGTERPTGLVPGSGRRGEPRALLSVPRLGTGGAGGHTFACPHFSIGGVLSASCVTCGPLLAVA